MPLKDKEAYNAYMRKYKRDYRELVKQQALERVKLKQQISILKKIREFEFEWLKKITRYMLMPEFQSKSIEDQAMYVHAQITFIHEQADKALSECYAFLDKTMEEFERKSTEKFNERLPNSLKEVKNMPEIVKAAIPEEPDWNAKTMKLVGLKDREKDVKKNLNHGVV